MLPRVYAQRKLSLEPPDSGKKLRKKPAGIAQGTKLGSNHNGKPVFFWTDRPA
jgi:hypothetical protein